MCFGFTQLGNSLQNAFWYFSEQRAKERKTIQCGVAVGQDVQDAREEDEACGVLAQGSKPPKTTSHINANAGTNDNNSDANALMGARGLSTALCSKLKEPNP